MTVSTMIVFTLNCWGIPFISKDRKERMLAIADHISSSDYDIVCLQEVWSESDFFTIRNGCMNSFPHSHYFYSGVMGSGLCVLSRWMIDEVFFHPWRLNGYVHKIQHGDWFGGKGIAYCRIIYKDLVMNVHIAHLHAKYHANDIYLAHRVMQGFALAEFVKLTSRSSDISILAGDLNTEPDDLVYRLISNVALLVDPFDVMTNASPFGTCQTLGNSYSVDGTLEGQRIDHIMYSSEYEVNVEKYCKPLLDRVPGKSFSFSDHDAVVCKLRLFKNNRQVKQENPRELLENLKKLDIICEKALLEIHQDRRTYFIYSLFISALILYLLPVQMSAFSQIINISQFLLALTFSYTFIMATIWNSMEKNSIKAARASVDKLTNSVLKKTQNM